MIGVAVGLGNVWRFPYMMGKYGGSAFLIVYLIFTLLFAIPALVGEITLGRSTRQGPLGAFRMALGPRLGNAIGYLLLLTILVAISYYVVVIANVLYSAFFSMTNGFSPENIDQYAAALSKGPLQYIIVICLLIGSLFVISQGLKNGIELVSKIFVPFFLVVITFLIYQALSLEGAVDYCIQFLKPDFSSMKAIDIFAALGQAVYSLSLGGTFMVIYGSYLQQQESLINIAKWTAVGDVGAALLASLFIVPTVLVYNLEMTSGPTLIFTTLPHLFGEMPGGQLVGTLFLLALGLVAILSLIAALDVAQSCFRELAWCNWSMKKVLLMIALIEVILAYPSAMYPEVIGILDLVFGSGMQLVGSGFAMMAVTWGLGKGVTRLQMSFPQGQKFDFLFFWLKWVIPAILGFVLIGYIYSTFNG